MNVPILHHKELFSSGARVILVCRCECLCVEFVCVLSFSTYILSFTSVEIIF